MRWSIAWVVFVVLAVQASMFAQQPAEQSLIQSTGCGRFHFVLGRITLDTFRYKKLRVHESLSEHADDEEFVCVTANEGIPSLHYLRQVGSSRITLDTTEINAIRIEFKQTLPSGLVERLLIQQPSTGLIQVVSSIGSQERSIQSSSFWHLMVEEPLLFDQQVLPVLALFLQRCQLDEFQAAVEKNLRQHARQSPRLTADHIRNLVEQLGAPQSRIRIRAQRELRELGVGILPLLESLDLNQLDAEQRQRIDELKRYLTGDRSDTPDRVAAWLSTDHDYWNCVCSSWSREDQQSVNRYLVAALGKGLGRDTNISLAARNNASKR